MLLAGALLLVAAACEPEATPLPVLPVATTPAPEQTAEADSRPAVMVDSLTLQLLPDEVLARLNALADVIAVDAQGGTLAGPALSVLPFDGGAPTGYTLNLTAQLDTGHAPLDNPELAAALAGFLTIQATGDLRLALANAGFPDGITLTVAVDPMLWPLLEGVLSGGPIRWFAVQGGAPAGVMIAAGAQADDILAAGGLRLGVLPLYAAGWAVELDAAGLPVFVAPSPG